MSKLFVLTLNTAEGDSPTALAHGVLIGLSRILTSEHSDQFGRLIDTEGPVFPLFTLQYIQDSDIIRIRDGVARIARFRSLPRNQLRPASQLSLLPGPGQKAYLDEKISGCIANVLHMGAEDVDSKAALSDLGIDSVMTASLRREMQKTLKVKVPPTLTWSYPTVGHLVGWFAEKVGN